MREPLNLPHIRFPSFQRQPPCWLLYRSDSPHLLNLLQKHCQLLHWPWLENLIFCVDRHLIDFLACSDQSWHFPSLSFALLLSQCQLLRTNLQQLLNFNHFCPILVCFLFFPSPSSILHLFPKLASISDLVLLFRKDRAKILKILAHSPRHFVSLWANEFGLSLQIKLCWWLRLRWWTDPKLILSVLTAIATWVQTIFLWQVSWETRLENSWHSLLRDDTVSDWVLSKNSS